MFPRTKIASPITIPTIKVSASISNLTSAQQLISAVAVISYLGLRKWRNAGGLAQSVRSARLLALTRSTRSKHPAHAEFRKEK